MGHLRIEARPDGSLLLTSTAGARWGAALGASGLGVLILLSLAAGGVTVLGAALALPLGLIALLAGLAAARHRDWVLFDRGGRQIVFRFGLASLFRPARALPYAAVEAIVIEDAGGGAGGYLVRLAGREDESWTIDASADPAYVSRLVARLHEAGGWPVLREGAVLPPPYRLPPAARP